MFNQSNQQYVRVSILLSDGSNFTGQIGCGLTAKIENALNSASAFVEIVDDNKKHSFISKNQILRVEAAPALAATGIPPQPSDSSPSPASQPALTDAA